MIRSEYDPFAMDDEDPIIHDIPVTASEQPAQLSLEQKQVLDTALGLGEGGVLFVSGKAGTGKSFVLRELRNRCRCAVLAPTGLAAVNVGGSTIHSFFGFRPGANRGALPERSQRALPYIDLIVIDEQSMVRADLVDDMDRSLRDFLGVDKPFGGKPMVCFGDIWQLEPVVASVAEDRILTERYGSPFFFDSKAWRAARAKTIELTHVFRQSGDIRFRDALNEIREGGTDSLPIFNERIEPHQGETLRLTLTNDMARDVNQQRLSQLAGDERLYMGQETGSFGKELPTERELRLKVGARVMCLSNNREEGFVNGDLGTIQLLGPDYAVVELDRGKTVSVHRHGWEKLAYSARGGELSAEVTAKFEQLPLRLAWAVTVHKAQGQTFNAIHLDMERPAFAHGQTYVALSRCRTLAGMSLGRRIVPADVICRPRVVEWCHGEWA